MIDFCPLCTVHYAQLARLATLWCRVTLFGRSGNGFSSQCRTATIQCRENSSRPVKRTWISISASAAEEVHLQYLIHYLEPKRTTSKRLLEPQIGPKRAKFATRPRIISQASKHSNQSAQILTNHFHGLAGHGLNSDGLGAGPSQTQQSKRPFSFAKSKPFARQLAKTTSKPSFSGSQAFSQQKLMWQQKGTSKQPATPLLQPRLKSYVGSGPYLPPPPPSPNQSKISFPQATASVEGTGISNFHQQSFFGEETEVSTKYNNVVSSPPPNSIRVVGKYLPFLPGEC